MQDQAHYFIAPVEGSDQKGIDIRLSRALISRQTILRFMGESESAHEAFLQGRIFYVNLEEKKFKGRLIREQGASGTHYNLLLLSEAEEKAADLGFALDQKGFPSPWKREYPRISVEKEPQLELPERVIFGRVAGQTIGRIQNFSYHGMLFQFQMTGLSVSEYVGQQFVLQIFSTRQRHLGKAEVQVMRIYDEHLNNGRISRSMGVRFLQFLAGKGEAYEKVYLEAAKGHA